MYEGGNRTLSIDSRSVRLLYPAACCWQIGGGCRFIFSQRPLSTRVELSTTDIASTLQNPATLTRDEYAVIRQHPYFTYSVLSTIGGIPMIADWATFHHEKLDGPGYPFHLDGKNLNTGSRILAVADVLTALAEDRPYRQGMQRDEVLSIIRAMGAKNTLDRKVIRILEENYEEIMTQTQGKQAEVPASYDQDFVGRRPPEIHCNVT